MRYKLLIIRLLTFILSTFNPLRAQIKTDSVIISTDTAQKNQSIMLSTEPTYSRKEKWESAFIIAGISLIMIILFNARSK